MKTEAVHGHRENALENSNREIRNSPRDWIAADTNRHGRRRRRSTAMLLQYSKRNLGRDEKENEKPPQHSSSSYQQIREQARNKNKNKRSRCHRKRAKIFFEKFKTKSILRDVQIIEKGSQRHRVHDQTPKENITKKKKAGKRQVQCVRSMTNGVEKSPKEH
jgi:hypothetical protein